MTGPKPNYLIFFEKKRRGAYVYIPPGFSSDAWGELQQRFVIDCGHKPRDVWDRFAQARRLFNYEVVHGQRVYYDEELAGPGGCSYEIYLHPPITIQQAQVVMHKIRRDHDVVRARYITFKVVDYQHVVDQMHVQFPEKESA